MENQFVWKDEFNIGVDIIDKEHKKLFKIINKLFEFKEEDSTRQWACREGIKFFKQHAADHFADEEAYMDSINYEGIEQHKHLHKGFRENTLPALELELEQSDYSPDSVEHFLGVCAGWLIGHTLSEDVNIVSNSVKEPATLLLSEDLAAMKKVIIQLLFDMFQLESHLISDTYNGEKFGNGVYYRLIYGTNEDKKKQEVQNLIDAIDENEGRINRVGASIVFVFFAAISIAIIVGTKVYAYSQNLENAKKSFEYKHYNEAYNEIAGMDIKEEDEEFELKVMVVMYAYKQLNSFQHYYAISLYPEALDSLLKGLERYDKYSALASIINVT